MWFNCVSIVHSFAYIELGVVCIRLLTLTKFQSETIPIICSIALVVGFGCFTELKAVSVAAQGWTALLVTSMMRLVFLNIVYGCFMLVYSQQAM
jgi:hypothetical protein